MKNVVQNSLMRFGYILRKAHPEEYSGVQTIDVLELAVRHLVSEKGPNIPFVQVGANDGKIGDPIRKFILEFAWRGILVEPQPDVFKRLEANYVQCPQVIFEQCAVGASDGTASFYTARKEGDSSESSTFASFNKARVRRYAEGNNAKVHELSVPVLTPATLVKKHGFSRIEFLQVDAEGYDFELLKLFDLGPDGPSLIHFESGNLKPLDQEKCYRYLNKLGYRLLTLRGGTVALRS